MRNKFLRYGTLLCCALLLLAGAGCRTHKHVTATEAGTHSRVETLETTVKADTAKTSFAALFSDSARTAAAIWDSINYVLNYDSAGRIESIRGSRRTAESRVEANTQQVQAASSVAHVQEHTQAAAADTTKHESAKETTSQTEAGGNVLSSIDRGLEVGVPVALGVVALVVCAWLIYRLRKLNEKWEQRQK